MEQFTIDTLTREDREINPSYLGKQWREFKHGRAFASSRDMFGSTAAAYRTLRNLAQRGLVQVSDRRFETYSIKKNGKK